MAEGESRMQQVAVRLPPPVVVRVDAEVTRRNALAGWKAVNRSDIIREFVEQGLARTAAASAPSAAQPERVAVTPRGPKRTKKKAARR